MAFTVKLELDGHTNSGESEEAAKSAIVQALREEVESAFKKGGVHPDTPENYGKCTYTKQVAK